MNVISIDLGTSHTYISKGSTESLNTQAVLFDGNSSGMETTLLYCNKPNSPLISRLATNEFGDSTYEERQQGNYKFVSHFKPDIVGSKDAQRYTVDFLRTILRDAEKAKIPLFPQSALVIIGVPSEASTEYKETLKRLAYEAGYGKVQLIDEPKGALFHELEQKNLSFEMIMDGLLVIDFGGGTCDFTYLRQGKIEGSWGEMDLGGRLFDDLFYQWFCEKRPDAKARIEADQSDFYVRTYDCREMKEKFSDTMINAKTVLKAASFKTKVGEYGQIKDLTWDEFLQRSRCYTPSESFLRFQREAGIAIPEKLRNGPIDLIDWFEKSLINGLKNNNIKHEDIHAISLAGGSSKWLFVENICIEKFKASAISQSLNPFAAISEGLAVYPALKREFEVKIQRIQDGYKHFISGTIFPLLINEMGKCANLIIDGIILELFTSQIKPVLEEFRTTGGTIVELEDRIADIARAYEDRLKQIIQDIYEKNIVQLYEIALVLQRNKHLLR